MIDETELMPTPGYIAYIDEAGDDGLRQIRTRDEGGASRWMVISAVLIKAEREPEVVGWLRDIIASLRQHQVNQLHFFRLPPDKKLLVCAALAEREVRIFVVLSHKRNMQGYRNIRADKAKVNRTAWFYCWLSKLLLERVTEYCGRRTLRDYGEARPIRFEFSDRGGVKIGDVRDYYRYLRDQSRMGMLHDPVHDLDWSVMDPDQIVSYPNADRAGLQLADIAASAFFAGLEPTVDGATRPEAAKLLLPRIALDGRRRRYGYGVKLMPVWVPNLPPEQAELIDFYMHR